jgi:hypothetical protein
MERAVRLIILFAAIVVLTAFAIPESGTTAPALGMQSPQVVTCIVQPETATQNSQKGVAYYECLALNKAVLPFVTFAVFSDGAGELWLRQLVGRTVDVRLEVVQ